MVRSSDTSADAGTHAQQIDLLENLFRNIVVKHSQEIPPDDEEDSDYSDYPDWSDTDSSWGTLSSLDGPLWGGDTDWALRMVPQEES